MATFVKKLEGFRYSNGFAFMVFSDDANASKQNAIIGSTTDWPIASLMAMKGQDVELEYTGEKTTSSGTYKRFKVVQVLL
jgi:hypothetical protein